MRRARNRGRGQALPEDAPHRERSLEDVMVIEDLQRQNQVQQQQIDELTQYCSPVLFMGTIHSTVHGTIHGTVHRHYSSVLFTDSIRSCEMCGLIEDVSRTVQTLQRRGRARAQRQGNSEPLPIYDVYEEDEAEFIDEEKPTKPFNVVLEPEKPLGFLEAAFNFVSRESDLFKSDSVIRDVNSLVRTLKEQVDAEEKMRKNLKGERIIRHGKIRGRIFSNKGSLMQEDFRETRKGRMMQTILFMTLFTALFMALFTALFT